MQRSCPPQWVIPGYTVDVPLGGGPQGCAFAGSSTSHRYSSPAEHHEVNRFSLPHPCMMFLAWSHQPRTEASETINHCSCKLQCGVFYLNSRELSQLQGYPAPVATRVWVPSVLSVGPGCGFEHLLALLSQERVGLWKLPEGCLGLADWEKCSEWTSEVSRAPA